MQKVSDFLKSEPVKVRLIACALFVAALLMLFLPWETVTDADTRRQVAAAAAEINNYTDNGLFSIFGGKEMAALLKPMKKLLSILEDGGITPLETGTGLRMAGKVAKSIRDLGSYFYAGDDETLAALGTAGALGVVYTLLLLVSLAAVAWTAYQMWMGRRRCTWAAMDAFLLLAVIFFGSSLVVWIRAKEMVSRPTVWCILAPLFMAAAWYLYEHFAMPAAEGVPLHRLGGTDLAALNGTLASAKEKGSGLVSHTKQALGAMAAPKTWVCPNCGTEMAGDKKFCGTCGSKRPEPQKCANCGKLQEPGVAFCSECGARFVPQRQCEKCGTPYLLSEKFCANCGSPVSYPRVEVKEGPAAAEPVQTE